MIRASELSLDEQISLLSGSTFWKTQPLPARGVPAVLLSDGPHGLRVQPGDREDLHDSLPATCFPTAAALASTWDEHLLEQVGRALGVEARSEGVSLVLGPGMNIKRHPLGGRNFEYFSEDPLLTGRLAAAMVRGVQSAGVGACIKHFAANNQECHRFVVDTVVDERTLREVYLAGFEHVVRHAGPWAVMAAYNLLNGTSCTDNRYLLSEILRDEWGFDGLVVSDWGATNDRVAATLAGMDLDMPGGGGQWDTQLRGAVATGELPRAAVTACADRVLRFVANSPTDKGPPARMEEHDDLARRAAAQSTVLLANDGILPLSPESTVALIGVFGDRPRYQGSGSSRVHPTRITTAREAFGDRGIEVRFAPGFAMHGPADPLLRTEAVAAARACDVVVLMVGPPPVAESEGYDRDELSLPADQDALVEAVCAANPRTVVALSGGGPVEMPWVQLPAAILTAHLAGQASGSALTDVLYGDVDPGGRLAQTWPVRRADLAADPFFPGQPHQVQYREGLGVGYRHAVTAGIEPLFAFGHGCSYTTFGIGAAVAPDTVTAGEDVRLRVPVTNTGDRTGSTVVQVYLHDRTGAIARPRRWLAGFARAHLDAGESVVADVLVRARAFAYYDTPTKAWQTPPGHYDLEIGTSSREIVQTLPLTVVGGFTARRDLLPLVAGGDEDFRRVLGRPIPEPRPVRPYSRMSTIGEISANPLGRLLHRVLLRAAGYHRSPDPTVAKSLLHSVEELPLRALPAFSSGKVGLGAVDGLVDALNGRYIRAGRRSAAGLAHWLGARLNRR